MKDAAMPSYMIVIVVAGVLVFVAGCILIWLERHKLSNLDGSGGVGGGFDSGSCDGGGGGH
jgi:uncharacterized membrane protein YgcG